MDNNQLSSRAVIGEYYARLENNPGASWVAQIANQYTSDQAGEVYAHLGQISRARKWVGGRQPQPVRTLPPFRVDNEHYENSVEFAVEDFRRDKTGQIVVRIQELADDNVNDWAYRLGDLLNDGASKVCYDTAYYFDTAHQEGESGVQSNKIGVDISAVPAATHGATTAPSKEEFQAMVTAGIAQILGFKGDKGVPMNRSARKFAVLVPLGYWMGMSAAMRPVLNNGLGNDTNPSLAVDGVDLSVHLVNELTWTDSIAVVRTDAPAKAMIAQRETEWELSVLAEGSEYAVHNKRYFFGVDSWRAPAYGYWQRACKVTAI
jgi:phage major head subunit gpT-like protein